MAYSTKKSTGPAAPKIDGLNRRIADLERVVARFAGDHDGHMHGAGDGREGMVGFCGLPLTPERVFDRTVSDSREHLIRYIDKKWVNGTTLKYWFFGGQFAGHPTNLEMVREAFGIWEDVGIGITFEETDDIAKAEIRIGFLRGDGA